MDDETEESRALEVKKAIDSLYEYLSLNQLSEMTAFSAFLTIMVQYHYGKGVSFEHFQDKMHAAVEKFRWRWEKKQ